MTQLERFFRAYESGETFTAFDTETTGLKAELGHVIEIGAIKFNKNGIFKTYGTLINPVEQIPWQVTQINNISNEMVADSPIFEQIAPDFLDFIADSTLIAHNAGFDIAFINTELSRAELPTLRSPAVPAIDTVKLAQSTFPLMKNHKLQYLAEQFKIDSGNAHRATDDARVCMEIFLKCLESFRKANPQTIEIQQSLF
jgi:DNA polymerase III epsilon subunit family exonuclease